MADHTPLSPAAQAVLDAVEEVCPAPADEVAAVVLRAAADRVVPLYPRTLWGFLRPITLWRLVVRAALYSIAAELDS